jgi:plastocyanin
MTGRTLSLFVAAAVATVAIAAAIPAGAFGGAHARAAASHTVVLKNVRFHPGTLSIARGDSVRWVWGDREEHNVTFHGPHSRTMTHGSYTVRFTQSGTFNYRCTIHESEGMKGKIVVH